MLSLKTKGTKLYCFDPNLKKYNLMGNKIGETFFKKVGPQHFMRVVNGYGLQYDAFVQFEKFGITRISILEGAVGKTWESEPVDWLKNGKIADYGRGKQIFLSLKFMRQKDKEKERAKREIVEAKRSETIQNSLL